MLEGVARGTATNLATGRLEYRIGRRQDHLVGRHADRCDSRFVDLLPENLAPIRVLFARFGHHHQAFGRIDRIVAGKYGNAAPTHARDAAHRLLELVGIKVAPAANDQILDPAGQIDLTVDGIGEITRIEPAVTKQGLRRHRIAIVAGRR